MSEMGPFGIVAAKLFTNLAQDLADRFKSPDVGALIFPGRYSHSIMRLSTARQSPAMRGDPAPIRSAGACGLFTERHRDFHLSVFKGLRDLIGGKFCFLISAGDFRPSIFTKTSFKVSTQNFSSTVLGGRRVRTFRVAQSIIATKSVASECKGCRGTKHSSVAQCPPFKHRPYFHESLCKLNC